MRNNYFQLSWYAMAMTVMKKEIWNSTSGAMENVEFVQGEKCNTKALHIVLK